MLAQFCGRHGVMFTTAPRGALRHVVSHRFTKPTPHAWFHPSHSALYQSTALAWCIKLRSKPATDDRVQVAVGEASDPRLMT